MFHKILVPLDGSQLAEQALPPALDLARPVAGEIVLLSVPFLKRLFVKQGAEYGLLLPEDSLQHSRRELTAYLRTVAASRARPGVTIRIEVQDGDEAGVIVDTAASVGADLIIMSTHGHTGLTRWMLGSVTEKVLRLAPCPVLVVREVGAWARILIALDGSPLAEHALAPGLEIARRLAGQVTLLRVERGMATATPLMWEAQLAAVSLPGAAELEACLRADAEAYLQQVCAAQAGAGVKPDTAVIFAPAAAGILDFAKENQVDVIVMCTHGRSGLARWVYGSVTEKVLRGASCAVLIVRPPAEQLG